MLCRASEHDLITWKSSDPGFIWRPTGPVTMASTFEILTLASSCVRGLTLTSSFAGFFTLLICWRVSGLDASSKEPLTFTSFSEYLWLWPYPLKCITVAVSVLDIQPRGHGFKSLPEHEYVSRFLHPLHPLVNSDIIMSTRTIHCRCEDWMAGERTGQQLSYAKTKKTEAANPACRWLTPRLG